LAYWVGLIRRSGLSLDHDWSEVADDILGAVLPDSVVPIFMICHQYGWLDSAISPDMNDKLRNVYIDNSDNLRNRAVIPS
jgi:hypothetical protein